MKILSIDTTAAVATAALTEDETLIALYSQKSGLTHSETMLPMVEALLKNAKISTDEIGMYCCSSGPGSFTGVRIGVSVIKGLAFGRNKICLGTSTLDALARNISGLGDCIVSPVMDARRCQLYNALFECKNGIIKRLCPDRLISAENLKEELLSYGLPVYFSGDGYNIATGLDIAGARITPPLLRWQNAYCVAVSALEKYNNAADKTVFTDLRLAPEYLRASQAEREAKEKS